MKIRMYIDQKQAAGGNLPAYKSRTFLSLGEGCSLTLQLSGVRGVSYRKAQIDFATKQVLSLLHRL